MVVGIPTRLAAALLRAGDDMRGELRGREACQLVWMASGDGLVGRVPVLSNGQCLSRSWTPRSANSFTSW